MNNNTLVIDALHYKRNKALGYQEYLFNLLDYFFDKRPSLKFYKIIILCEFTQQNDFLKYNSLFEIIGFRAPTVYLRILVQNVFAFRLKLKKTDTILFTANYSSFIKKSNHILVIHDLLFLRKELLPNILMRFQRQLTIPRSVNLADCIIAISDTTKTDIVKSLKVPSTKIEIVYNYFNFNKFNTNSKIVNPLPINISSKFILSVSSMLKHKNIITLLKAFSQFATLNFDTNLVLVGSLKDMYKEDFDYFTQLSNNVKARIYITGNISNSELGYLYSNCECFVLPTLFEGLGMPIVEAMYFKAPIVLSDIEVCREISGGNAIFFNPLDFKRLSEILINTEYHKLLQIDNSNILERFSEQNTSCKYIELLNKKLK